MISINDVFVSAYIHFFIKAHPSRTWLSSNLTLLVTNARTKKVSEMALKQHKFAFESANVSLEIVCKGP